MGLDRLDRLDVRVVLLLHVALTVGEGRERVDHAVDFDDAVPETDSYRVDRVEARPELGVQEIGIVLAVGGGILGSIIAAFIGAVILLVVVKLLKKLFS